MSNTRKDSFRDSFESAMRRRQVTTKGRTHSPGREDFMDEYEEDLKIEEEIQALEE
jgi:hypothetical protein